MTEHDESVDQEAIADQAHFVLSAERWDAFCRALDAPPKEIPSLRRLLTEKCIFDEERPTEDLRNDR